MASGATAPGISTHLRVVSTARLAHERGTPAPVRRLAVACRSRSSRGAMLMRRSSRVSTSTFPLASRIAPRVAGREADTKCCRSALAAHLSCSMSCTCAARATSASANSSRAACTTPVRLGSRIANRPPWENYHLPVRRYPHAEPLLRDRNELLPARRGADVAREPRAVALELQPPLPEL